MNCNNHKRCFDEALKDLESICKQKSLKLTNLRKKIFAIIYENHSAVKAYDVLKKLQESKISDKPPTIYRALDFFIKNNIVHKIHSLNSYIVCSHLNKHYECQLFICEKCKNIQEFCNPELTNFIKKIGKNNRFEILPQILEIKGFCKECNNV